MIKINRSPLAEFALYRNEVAVYRNLRLELPRLVETPRCVGAAYDEKTNTFALAMEDMAARGAEFWNVTRPTTLEHLQSLLDSYAALHAAYWDSPRFANELAWVQPHVEGELHVLFNHPDMIPAKIRHQLEREQFKRELVEMIGQNAENFDAQMKKVQAHQATRPRTLCHGDSHIGNTYLLDGRGGLIDWQLAAYGSYMHDVHYIIVTALSVGQRREAEADLIRYYLEQLARHGLAEVPSFDDAWLEYRRAIVWGLYIGWLTTPVENYGWEITVGNHIRLATAYADLEAAAAIASID